MSAAKSGNDRAATMRAPDFTSFNPGYARLARHARARRGHPRLYGVRQTKDVDGRNKSGHDGGYARSALLDPHAGLIAVGEYDAGFF
jgi:hypothetical protein